jgi:hypothetical protein
VRSATDECWSSSGVGSVVNYSGKNPSFKLAGGVIPGEACRKAGTTAKDCMSGGWRFHPFSYLTMI